MDTQKEKALIVHMDNTQIKCSQMPGGLYTRKPKENNNENIIEDNKKQKQTYLTNFYPIDKLKWLEK